MNKLTSLIFAALLLAPLASLHAAGLTNLRCEYRGNPLGIDVVKPRLSWVIEDRGQKSEIRAMWKATEGNTPSPVPQRATTWRVKTLAA